MALYGERFSTKGTPAPDTNYYQGSLYAIGREYMDAITDLQGTTAAIVTATVEGIDPETMEFVGEVRTFGDVEAFNNHFGYGMSASDHDGDPSEGSCALRYGHVLQHYRDCWSWNYGFDADPNTADGGVGPHASNWLLQTWGLAIEPEGGRYSRVERIARYVRW